MLVYPCFRLTIDLTGLLYFVRCKNGISIRSLPSWLLGQLTKCAVDPVAQKKKVNAIDESQAKNPDHQHGNTGIWVLVKGLC